MKKVLLIGFIIFCIFQMMVLATVIDIGLLAIDRVSNWGEHYTYINKGNPANADGIITSIEIWAKDNISNCEVATFFVVSGDNLSTRDTHTIGSVTAGSKQTFSGLSIDVHAGDYLGIFFNGGKIETQWTGEVGVWHKISVDAIPCTNYAFDYNAGYGISLYGTGATIAGIKWNTKTISKWNTKTISKWNGM